VSTASIYAVASLVAVLTRVEWAERDVETLNSEIDRWLEHQPYAARLEFYEEERLWVVQLRMPTPPLVWGVVVGNIVHNLRSALDNLVWQLVLLNGEQPRSGPRGNDFPIFGRPVSDFKKAAATSLAGVAPQHVAQIEAVQPQNSSAHVALDAHPFAALSELANADKHRVLTPVSIGGPAGEEVLVNFRTEEPGVVAWRETFLERLEDGATVACCQLAPSYQGAVEATLELPIHVELRERRGVKLTEMLWVLCFSTRNLVCEFASDFPSPA